jgi:O-antigen ligase
MRPIGILGTLLLLAGLVVLVLRGVSYTKDKEEVKVGPIEIEAKEKGFITPTAGIVAMAVGAVLVFAGRGKVRA